MNYERTIVFDVLLDKEASVDLSAINLNDF